MDNVTHSIAGLLLAEAAVQIRRSRAREPRWPSDAFRTVAALTAVAASNFPDGDLVYSTGKLGYMLHHRGHTHTLIVALLLAPVAWALALGIWRLARRRDAAPVTAADRRWLLAICVVGTLSHVGFDSLNSYGVHPFWPVDNRWYYGDALFILEPWLWVIAVPPLLLATRRVGMRIFLGLVLAAGLAAAWLVSFVPWGVALALTLAAAAFAGLAMRLRPGARIAAAFAAWGVVGLAFLIGTRAARAEVGRATAGDAARQLDVVITPAVSNPLCHTVFVVDVEGPLYRVRAASVAAAPSLLPAARCAPQPRGSSPMMWRSARPGTAGVRWDTEWSAPAAGLVALYRDNCVIAAALRFMRVPAWFEVRGDSMHVGDLRYDRGTGEGFAEIRVPRTPPSCPASVPPWRPPRADVVGVP